MKKLNFFIFIILILLPSTVLASPQFDKVLSEKIGEYGVFSGNEGLIYAGERNFENSNSLFIVYVAESAIKCESYDNTDGIQFTDELNFPYGGNNAYRLATVKKDGLDYVMLSSTVNSKTTVEFFKLENDTFVRADNIEYDSITYITGYEKGKIVPYVSSKNIFNFLNTLKERTLSDYPFPNRVNIISADDSQDIKRTLTACADIMSFDIKNYDYDTLFKYVLYTHKNFQILTDIPADSGSSSSLGYNSVSIVRSDFIDYVMQSIFRITPEKPPVNNLLNRGFCYSDGYYYYTGGFTTFFATEIIDLIGVYDIGGGVVFTVFSDIYSENDSQTPEYSFAVLQKTGGAYSLLRLGMGENLPSAEDIRQYSPFSTYNNIEWGKTPAENTAEPKNNFILPVLLLIISAGTVGVICGIVALVKQRRS